jgi:hypothetical protein
VSRQQGPHHHAPQSHGAIGGLYLDFLELFAAAWKISAW